MLESGKDDQDKPLSQSTLLGLFKLVLENAGRLNLLTTPGDADEVQMSKGEATRKFLDLPEGEVTQ